MPARKHELIKQWADDDSLDAWYFDPKFPDDGFGYTMHPSFDKNLIYELHPAGVKPNWITWNGGECPVHPESVVAVVFKDGDYRKAPACAFVWESVICYRVIKEHVEANPHQAMIDEHKLHPEKVVQIFCTTHQAWEDCIPSWRSDHKYRFKLPHQELRDMAEADPSLKWECRLLSQSEWSNLAHLSNFDFNEHYEYRPIPKTRTVRKWLWNLSRDLNVYLHTTYVTEEGIKVFCDGYSYKIHSRTEMFIDVEEPAND